MLIEFRRGCSNMDVRGGGARETVWVRRSVWPEVRGPFCRVCPLSPPPPPPPSPPPALAATRTAPRRRPQVEGGPPRTTPAPSAHSVA